MVFGGFMYLFVFGSFLILILKGNNKTGLLLGVQPYIAYKVNGNVQPYEEKMKKIVFTGTLHYSTSGRQLDGKLKTNAVWKNAFGYPQLTVKRMSAR